MLVECKYCDQQHEAYLFPVTKYNRYIRTDVMWKYFCNVIIKTQVVGKERKV